VKEVAKPGQVSLRIDEIRPTQPLGSFDVTLEPYTYPNSSTVEDTKFHHGVVEYWLVMQSYTDDDFLIATDTIPLLPIGAQRVRHEQVIFEDSTSGATNPNAAQLIFYADDDGTDVVVYRNGTELIYSTDWEFISAGEADVGHLTVIVPGGGSAMKRGIKISGTVQPLDIYTVSYTPVVSNTHTLPSETTLLKTVDLIGDESARVVASNIVVFEEQRLSYTVAYAKMYLVVLMRRNSAKESFSPAVEEYMLVTGSKNTEKFSGD